MERLIALSSILCGLCSMAAPTHAETTRTSPTVDQAEVDKALNDLNSTLTEARAVPKFEHGKPAGHEVAKPSEGNVYEKLQLRNGDVIKSVNGQPINDPGQAFQRLSDAKAIDVEVARDGDASPSQDSQQGEGN